MNNNNLGVRQKNLPIEKYCSYKNIELYTQAYNCSNAKDAIIFLHGLGGTHKDGSFLYNSRNKYMTICIDMLNHGQSGKIENLTWDTYVDAVKAVIDKYNVKKADFVGHSFGADVAMMYTYKYPQDVKNVVLLDRAYYNFSDIAKYNFTSSFYKIINYNPDLSIDFNSFNVLIDMMYQNDISKTWNINKDVLLLAADPYRPIADEAQPCIIDYISMIKKSPDDFGISSENASSLPDLTWDNLNAYMDFLNTKINEFPQVNKRFFAVQTPFEHDMVNNDSAKEQLLEYVLEFLKYDDKNIFVNNFN